MKNKDLFRKIRCGGMGVNISDWHLAKTISMLGQIGTISGTTLDRVLSRILQNGDPGGHIRRAFLQFPFQVHVEKILKEYFIPGGIKKGAPYKAVPFFTINPDPLLISLIICANYAFVYLAKEGHDNPISINYLQKVSMSLIYAITGAMLASVDEITIGAGIPIQIPKVINDILQGNTLSYNITVIGKNITTWTMTFDPKSFFGSTLSIMKKPRFIPIISSNLLALILMTKLPPESVWGFVVEEPSAGGHNAPPKNKIDYGEKDVVNYSKIAELGLPFWIGGSKASPEGLQWALSVGANGIQVGSIFAFCKESGMDPIIRKQIQKFGYNNMLNIITDYRVSPTGYPFKVASVPGSLSEKSVYESRVRKCNQGGLISLYEKSDGTIDYRCAAEAVNVYVRKGGTLLDTNGRGCLCNGLLSTCGLGDYHEPPIITIGDDYSFLHTLMKSDEDSYTAKDAINYLLAI